jgi:type IV pilus assembly protein PilP
MSIRTSLRRGATLAYVAATIGLGGCVSQDMSELQAYVNEVLARKGGIIDPLPEIKPYERYLYQAGEQRKRDPFQGFAESMERQIPGKPSADPRQREFQAEIDAKNAEELEGFELDSLRMVGTLDNGANLWGIVKDATGTVHRVQVGNYMGRNFGKILSIGEDKIELRELVKDVNGNWEERQATLALAAE